MKTRFDRYYERQMRDPEMRELVQRELLALEVGIQIARLRRKKRLNQTQLGARAGMSASKVSVIENSDRNLTLATLVRLARALDSKVKISFVPGKRAGHPAVARRASRSR